MFMLQAMFMPSGGKRFSDLDHIMVYVRVETRILQGGCSIVDSCRSSRGHFPILSRDLSRKPPETQGKRIRFLKRTMAERMEKEQTPRFWVGFIHPKRCSRCSKKPLVCWFQAINQPLELDNAAVAAPPVLTFCFPAPWQPLLVEAL